MPQDAFTIKFVAKELKELLVGGKISRIIQPNRDCLTFIIYTRTGNVKLEACLSARDSRLGITENDASAPVSAPNFCMLLRKHLQNAEILDVVQPDFERIIYFDLMCVSDFSSSVMRLYFEIMGKYSNAVLCENGIILGALKTSAIGENTKRVLFGGVKYVPPEPQDKASPEIKLELENAMRNASGDKAKFISEHVKGIAYATALDMVKTYGEEITADDIYKYVCLTEAEPCVIYADGVPVDFKVRASGGEKKFYDTVLKAQDAYYSYICGKRAFEEKKTKLKSALNSAVKKAEKRLAALEEKSEECAEAETVKLKGELITANIYSIQRGTTCFSAVNYYDPDGNSVKIDLDRNLTPAQNAQKYYKRYAKLKRTKESVAAQRPEAESKYDYLKSIEAHLNSAESAVDLEETEEELISSGLLKPKGDRKKPAATPFRAYTVKGFKIIAGRNNLQNERLTKGLSSEDIWLHTQKYHSSHVGIISDGREIPGDVLTAAAEICAFYSDGKAGNKIPVDYTKKKFVKRPPKANAGFVIYTDYKTVLVNPDAHKEDSDE